MMHTGHDAGDALEENIGSSDLLSQLLAPLRLSGEDMAVRMLRKGEVWTWPSGTPVFHLVQRGSVEVHMADRAVGGELGDLLMFAGGAEHRIFATAAEPTHIVSGTFRHDETMSGGILSGLPDLLHIPQGQGENAEWLEPLVHFLLAESRLPGPGAAIMISRLIDVLVVRTLRSWAAAQNGAARGWIGGLTDRRVERALSALHAQPLKPWTVESLAGVAVMSRSAFAERFLACTGEPPLRYLKHWRLSLARDLLISGSRTVNVTAREVGYASEAAFSRAFRSRFGYPPRDAR